MSESDQSQLDSLETSGVSRPPESYRKICKSTCPDELTATRSLYEIFDVSKSSARLENFDNCRTGAYFVRNVLTGKVRVRSSSCKLRWCPMCSATRRWFLTQQVSSWLKTAKKPKFLTLTLAHSTDSLDTQLVRLYGSFRKYRKLNIMKRNVSGGVWFFQIHKAKADNLWHPHLHCVIDSEWIDKYELSTAWKAVTGDSEIICIKEVKDSEAMAQYVARYAARPSLLTSLDTSDRLELAESLHGRRLVGTWGNARSISLRPGKPPDADNWESVGSYSTVHGLYSTDARAKAIWDAYRTDGVIPSDCTLIEFEREIRDEPPPYHYEPIVPYQAFFDFG